MLRHQKSDFSQHAQGSALGAPLPSLLALGWRHQTVRFIQIQWNRSRKTEQKIADNDDYKPVCHIASQSRSKLVQWLPAVLVVRCAADSSVSGISEGDFNLGLCSMHMMHMHMISKDAYISSLIKHFNKL